MMFWLFRGNVARGGCSLMHWEYYLYVPTFWSTLYVVYISKLVYTTNHRANTTPNNRIHDILVKSKQERTRWLQNNTCTDQQWRIQVSIAVVENGVARENFYKRKKPSDHHILL